MTRPLRAPRLRVALIAGVLAVTAAVAMASAIALRGDADVPQPLRIAVVGDDYAAGTQNRVVWPTLLAERTGWAVSNFALPGAGYAADGRGGYAFTYQVDRAQGAGPDIILVVGGLQDTGFPDAGPIKVGAAAVVDKAVLGGERLLVIGPTWYETPVPDSVRRVSDAVRGVADSAGISFREAIDPPWLTTDVMLPDLAGPTDAGQSVLADTIAEWVRAEVGG
ncbi:SGNH/GDSL hydrolase family protein [Rhodococcus maanshanensis]|uniref:GDSL-like Lipase/Acylhydrolase family protein n=1 Tax=Rhodococcus maanshanensis TaxID=183556 RepID=A0A1H7MM87_9NOCA|nr:SGNH/GDSL hydrolase family protein [Rhodococcus maanshanensis]SEL12342.1 GDSL-like Lipase/Acylhydrolase family protein [Rhodococcus maanshanensis]